ncbi:hypothetical protein K488DRAFT_84342 [Vararia minispora EC-137]|uniref:Uncharacterized protein n=1 Tax=Vararia minispora EC-137 TaxID=1314806 RepID=A0ACB8QQL8_9AGAM|nr:hypothetical protein K488DRAFT_84342 [Vararia minispora EC-137]
MSIRARSRGKRRADPFPDAHPDLSPPAPEARPTKRPKRAETRDCPICAEPIPLRLLAQHADLEAERVDAILAHVGDLAVWADPHAGHADIGASTSRRRATTTGATPHASPSDHTAKTIRDVQRRRRARHTLLRDATRDDDDDAPLRRAESVHHAELCPVCQQLIPGDPDVVNAHVDSCLAHAAMQESLRADAERAQRSRTSEEDVDVDGEDESDPWEEITAPDGTSRVRLRTGGANARRLGFEVRDRLADDVEADVDVDGEDDAVFGAVQFTEADVVDGPREEALATEESVEGEIMRARKAGDLDGLVAALEGKVKFLQSAGPTPSTVSCRVCLDPYVEPTISTGCWHVYCRECWLRCLGSTKLCPICKRITTASDLRRIYL